jgi:predicted transcriptional regulator
MTPVVMLETRKRIYQCIETYPGIHFRELQRKVGIGVGNLDYHLHYLTKQDLIMIEKFKERKLFYSLGLNQYERDILAVLRQKNYRQLILCLLENSVITQKELIICVKRSQSSVSARLKVLISRKLIISCHTTKEKKYKLGQPIRLMKVLITHQESFLDKVVDRVVDAWEE